MAVNDEAMNVWNNALATNLDASDLQIRAMALAAEARAVKEAMLKVRLRRTL